MKGYNNVEKSFKYFANHVIEDKLLINDKNTRFLKNASNKIRMKFKDKKYLYDINNVNNLLDYLSLNTNKAKFNKKKENINLLECSTGYNPKSDESNFYKVLYARG